MSIPIAGEDVLGLPFRIPDDVVSTVLALALSHFPIYVSVIPLFLFHWEFWRLEEREGREGGGREGGGEGREKGGRGGEGRGGEGRGRRRERRGGDGGGRGGEGRGGNKVMQ